VSTAHAEKTAAAAAAAPPAKKIDVGTVAAIGVALGAIGTLLAQVGGKATDLMLVLPFWKLCIGAGLVLLAVSGPSMLIAWLKLRQRNLGPILDANGWAVNGRVLLGTRLGNSLTSVAAAPEGSMHAAGDPFEDRRSPWPRVFLAVVAILFVGSLAMETGLVDWITAMIY
jgi:hypothetical protein